MQNAPISVVLLSLTACVAQGAGQEEGASTPTSPDASQDPTSETDVEGALPSIASEYQLRSSLALTTGSLAPPPAYELLQDLESDPGSALVAIAEAAGLPAAELLFDALPSSLSGKLTTWMSAALGSSSEFQTLLAWSQVVLAEVELTSTLSIATLDADDHASASHVLETLIFHVDGKEIEQAIPSIESLRGAGQADLELWIESEGKTLDIVLGEHRFGLLVGEAAYLAFEEAVVARYGTDLRGVLGSALDCNAMAEVALSAPLLLLRLGL